MKNLSYITLFFIIFLVSGCFIKITKSAPPPPPKVYPKEANFLEEMGIGDTVFFFIKESSYFNTNRNSSYLTRLTCYAKLEVFRADTFLFLSREYFAIPGGAAQDGPFLEFDTLKFKLERVTKAYESLDTYCQAKHQTSTYALKDSCLLRIADGTGKSKRMQDMIFHSFTKLGMCDPVYNEWRFKPPDYEELENWRKSVPMPNPKIESRFEVLSFYKDTCKISYCNELPITFPYDFSRLR